MPELPEVETLVRELRPHLEGRRIARVAVRDARVLEAPAAVFRRRLKGRTIRRLWRRGKWAVLALDSGDSMLVQLRMTGQIRLSPPTGNDHVRLEFELEGGRRFWYCDTRCLGRVALLSAVELAERLSEKHQGPEALEITLGELSRRLDATARSIKPFLLDQRAISGIGNLYADEILHAARIHPERPARSLTTAARRRLHRATRAILRRAIEHRGSTLRDGRYVTTNGDAGAYQALHAVYGREGAACLTCGAPVVRKRIAGLIGRSSYFCAVCQK